MEDTIQKRKKSLVGDKGPAVHFQASVIMEKDNSKIGKSTKTGNLLNVSQKLSKSQDNLASMLRKKALQMSTSVGNKDNIMRNARLAAVPRTKQPIISPAKLSTPLIRKSSSQQNIENGGTAGSEKFSPRTQSAQNICKIPLPIATRGSKMPLIKRSCSAQNMINGGGQQPRLLRLSSNAVAYNAELLSNFEKERKTLERRISELIQTSESRKAQVEKLKFELRKQMDGTSSSSEDAMEMIESLRLENQKLRDQLNEHGIAITHFTDNEKLLLLDQVNSGRRNSGFESLHGDDPMNLRASSEGAESWNLHHFTMGQSVGDLSSLTPQHASSFSTVDFGSLDRQNSVSVDRGLSDVGIAFLRDRIHQMQETHYSTNEELQATLQELSDLQDNVNELTAENERLIDEKSIVLESLCTQTVKLENARLQIEHLKALLIQDSEINDRSENERQLVALVKSAQEEREELLLKQAEFNNTMAAFENENKELQDIISALRDRAELEDSKNKVILNERINLEMQTCDLKKQNVKDQLELARIKSQLEMERHKAIDIGVEGVLKSSNETDELTKEAKETLESHSSLTTEELLEMKNTIDEVQERNKNLTDELQVSKMNAKVQMKKFESKVEELEMEKTQMLHKMSIMEEDLLRSRAKCEQCLEENKAQTGRIQRLDLDIASLKKQAEDAKLNLLEKVEEFQQEREEWIQFQKDLQMAVVVANNFKTETQYSLESIVAENQMMKEKVMSLQKELNALKIERDSLNLRHKELESSSSSSASSSHAVSGSDIRDKIISTVDRELAVLRHGRLSIDSGKSALSNLIIKQTAATSMDEQFKVDRPLVASNSDVSLTFLDSQEEKENCADDGKMTELNDFGLLKNRLDSLEVNRENSSDSKKNVETDSELKSSTISATETTSESLKKKGILINKTTPTRKTMIITSENHDKSHTSEIMNSSMNGSGNCILHNTRLDPLASLAKQLGGSKRNALLKWCQNKMTSYPGIDITNFSSSWNDGLAFCALLHSYMPDKIPFKDLNNQDKMRNFKCAFDVAESIGLTAGSDLNILIVTERPDWQAVFTFVTNIYKYFEVEHSKS